jgi:hypothetical protein
VGVLRGLEVHLVGLLDDISRSLEEGKEISIRRLLGDGSGLDEVTLVLEGSLGERSNLLKVIESIASSNEGRNALGVELVIGGDRGTTSTGHDIVTRIRASGSTRGATELLKASNGRLKTSKKSFRHYFLSYRENYEKIRRHASRWGVGQIQCIYR